MPPLIKYTLWGRCPEASQAPQDPHIGLGRHKSAYVAQLLGIDFSLNHLWSAGHAAVLQLVNALPVVDLNKNRHSEMYPALTSMVGLVPFPHPTKSQMTRKRTKGSS